jgi:hypothetical protein
VDGICGDAVAGKVRKKNIRIQWSDPLIRI